MAGFLDNVVEGVKKLKNKLVATPEEMQKMTENRADVQNAKQRAIGGNPAVNKADMIEGNATGLKSPVVPVTTEQAITNTTSEPAKTEGGSVLGDLVDQEKVDDTVLSGALGGTKDGQPITTEEKTPTNTETSTTTSDSDPDPDPDPDTDPETPDDLTEQQKLAQDTGLKEYEIAQKVLDENNPYKSGADYLKALWGKGAGGKAAAIANVLGNVLGAVGSGAAGKDYTSDWQKYKDDYTKQSMERRAQASQDAQDMVKTAAQNQAARNELVYAVNQAIAQGAKISQSGMEALNKWQNATTPSSALNKAVASVIAEIGEKGIIGTGANTIHDFFFGRK